MLFYPLCPFFRGAHVWKNRVSLLILKIILKYNFKTQNIKYGSIKILMQFKVKI